MKDDKNGLLDDLDAGGGGEPAPVAGAEPTPDVQGDADKALSPQEADVDAGGKQKRGDPTIALRQARDETKAEKKARQELEQRYARLETNTNRILEKLFGEQQAEQQQADPEPSGDPNSPDFDPIGRLAWQDRKLAELQNYVVSQANQQQAISQEFNSFQTAYNTVSHQFAQAVQTKPELADAYQHVLRSYAYEYAVNGIEGMLQDGSIIPGSQLDNTLKQHEATIIAYCYQTGRPIDDYLTGLAYSRGWQAPAPQPGQEQDTRTAEERARDERGRFVKSEDRTAQIAQSQNANRSLSQGSGAPTKKMTAKELAEMSEEEMWAEFKRNPGKQFDRAMNFSV